MLARQVNEKLVLMWLQSSRQYPGQPIISSVADFAGIPPAAAMNTLADLAERGVIRVDSDRVELARHEG